MVGGSILFGLFDALLYPASTAALSDVIALEHFTASNSLNQISGTLMTVGNILWNSLPQSEVLPEMVGRVSSVDWAFSLGLATIGVGIVGAVSGVVDIRTNIVVPTIATGVFLCVRSLSVIDRTPRSEHSERKKVGTLRAPFL